MAGEAKAGVVGFAEVGLGGTSTAGGLKPDAPAFWVLVFWAVSALFLAGLATRS